MSVRQNRHRDEKRKKKELKKDGLALLSSSGEGRHYEGRSKQRSQSGGVVLFCAKKLKKMLRDGKAKIIKKDSSGKKIRLQTGEVIVVDKSMEQVITYLGKT